MSHYICPRRSGTTIFLTVTLAQRGSDCWCGKSRACDRPWRGNEPSAERETVQRMFSAANGQSPARDAGPSALRLGDAGGKRGVLRTVGRDQGAVPHGVFGTSRRPGRRAGFSPPLRNLVWGAGLKSSLLPTYWRHQLCN